MASTAGSRRCGPSENRLSLKANSQHDRSSQISESALGPGGAARTLCLANWQAHVHVQGAIQE